MVRFVVLNNPPWIIIKKFDATVVFTGYLRELYDYIVHSLNLSVTLVASRDGKTGSQKDGNWTGALGMMLRNETDVIFQAVVLNRERFDVGEFSSLLATTHYTVLSSRNKEGEATQFFSIKTVNRGVWLIAFSLLALVSMIFYYTDNIENALTKTKTKLQRFRWWKYIFAFSNVFILKAIPLTKRARTLGRRFLLFTWMFGFVLFVSVVSSSIVSRLAVTSDDHKIDKLTDILKYKEIRPLVRKGSFIARYIQSSKDARTGEVWQQIIKRKGEIPVQTMSSQSHIEDVLKRKSVVISSEERIAKIMNAFCTNDSNFYVAKENFLKVLIALVINRKLSSNFRENLNLRIQRYVDTALMKKAWQGPTIQISCEDTSSVGEGNKPLNLRDIALGFRLWFSGLSISIFFILFETIRGLL